MSECRSYLTCLKPMSIETGVPARSRGSERVTRMGSPAIESSTPINPRMTAAGIVDRYKCPRNPTLGHDLLCSFGKLSTDLLHDVRASISRNIMPNKQKKKKHGYTSDMGSPKAPPSSPLPKQLLIWFLHRGILLGRPIISQAGTCSLRRCS